MEKVGRISERDSTHALLHTCRYIDRLWKGINA